VGYLKQQLGKAIIPVQPRAACLATSACQIGDDHEARVCKPGRIFPEGGEKLLSPLN
jgi:hypothetical protein